MSALVQWKGRTNLTGFQSLPQREALLPHYVTQGALSSHQAAVYHPSALPRGTLSLVVLEAAVGALLQQSNVQTQGCAAALTSHTPNASKR